jgi:protein FrlC
MSLLARSQLIGANFAFQHYPFDKVAQVLSGFGLREIELWGVAQHLDLFHAADTRIDLVRRILDDHGLSTWCFTPEQVLYPINIASGDDDLRRDSVQRFCRAADICSNLGARYLFLTSGRGYETDAPEAAWSRAVESLRTIAEHARQNGIRCLLEPLQRVETNILLNAQGLRRMLDDVAAENIDVVLDTVAMASAGDTVADYIRLFGSRVAHVQVVDGTPAGHFAWGDGNLPLGRYIGELAESGYTGKITFEPFGNGSYALDPVATWKRCLAAIDPYFNRAPVNG